MSKKTTEIIQENTKRRRSFASKHRRASYPENEPIDVERCKRDFQYWAARTVKIRDKKTGKYVPFVLNRAQRRVLGEIEKARTLNKPIRLILLKSRQWGGSTLIQIYMSWIQIMLRENWNSAICAHLKDCARNIRNMYTRMLESYPGDLTGNTKKRIRKNSKAKISFAPFEGGQNVRIIKERNCRVTIASAESQDSIRGSDIQMAHLSEVAYWKSTNQHDPEDFLRAVCGSVPLEPLTVVALESTANGVGNFFHTEWLRAEKGLSDKVAIFVPWYEIDIYTQKVTDVEAFWESMNAYERNLWYVHGCTLDQINWYRHKAAEYPKAELMHAEFPTTPEEAFVSSDSNVFNYESVEVLRKKCKEGTRGELNRDGVFVKDSQGLLEMWERPQTGKWYVVTVDVGGRTDKSDWSVIAVMKDSAVPSVVAQWRGHCDHDILAEKAVGIAQYYNEGLLVIESNSLESADESTVSSTVLSKISRVYPMTYRRRGEKSLGRRNRGVGFHTNRQTKNLVINALIESVRDRKYIERDHKACNELTTYCRLSNGSYEARRGCHDDILMTRAIGLYVLSEFRNANRLAPEPDELSGMAEGW